MVIKTTPLYVAAGVVIAAGWVVLPSQSPYWWVPPIVGLALLVFLTAQRGAGEPWSAMALLLTVTASFWLWMLSWVTSAKFIRRTPPDAMWSGWFLVVVSTGFFELIVLLSGLRNQQSRRLCLLGILLLVAQTFFAMRLIWLAFESY